MLLALSGGVDSVVLCDLLHKTGYDFSITHCNFQLRGEESHADENFAQSLAQKYNRKVYSKKFDAAGYADAHKVSTQMAARELRYSWFTELIKNGPENILVTAHHANDNIETLLMNFFKGTGIKGLQGIEPRVKHTIWIVRPLLFAKKESLLQYAKENDLNWREDASNASDKYTRNYFRNQLIPSLQKVFPQAEDNLMDNLKRFADIETLYRQSVKAAKRSLISEKDHELQIPVFKLLQTPAYETVLYEIVKEHGFSAAQVPEIVKLLHAESGKYIANDRCRILRNRNWLILSEPHHPSSKILIDAADKQVWFGMHTMLMEKKDGPVKIISDEYLAQLDAGKIKFPLLLRRWKQGDYFYPLGMKKKKKLSRFFIDKKLSLTQKENTWVLETNKKIIWVLGMRIDERFKISPSTTKVLQLKIEAVK
ncbi:MAG: tRNA lysidine(34) synthetase TilS [Ferruginibacter sp.]